MTKNFSIFPVLAVIFLALTSSSTTAGALSLNEIVARANRTAYYAGDDSRADVKMTITDAQGRTRNREFVILRRDVADGGEQEFYVYFKKPVDVRKMVFLVHKFQDRDDDRWLYLPALDLVKRIVASDKRTSFVGSNFVYEDVSGRGVNEDVHELFKTTTNRFIIKNTPKDPTAVEFSSYNIWLDRATFMPVKAEYYDKEGHQYRLFEALEVRKIQGYPTVVKSRIKDLNSGGETVSELSGVRYNIGLDDKIFTERYLRRPPRAVRK